MSVTRTVPVESPTNPFQYTARESDPETGLYYYRARYYDPTQGRFVSEDPLELAGGNLNFYAYVRESPLDLIDPFGLQDNASPWQLGWEWLSGTGPRVHNFGDGDPMTELLRRHQHIKDLVKSVCDGTLPPNGKDPYSLGGVAGVPKYARDYSTLATAGHTGNLAVTYLGSYDLSYSETSNTLTIHVSNVSSIGSATHPPIIGYTNWWDKHVAQPLGESFSSGPMSPTRQNFDFHQQLDCGCK